jgi:hypothetical protein
MSTRPFLKLGVRARIQLTDGGPRRVKLWLVQGGNDVTKGKLYARQRNVIGS